MRASLPVESSAPVVTQVIDTDQERVAVIQGPTFNCPVRTQRNLLEGINQYAVEDPDLPKKVSSETMVTGCPRLTMRGIA